MKVKKDVKNMVIYAPKNSEAAYGLSEKLGIELVSIKPDDDMLYLKSDDTGLSLNQGGLELRGDFSKLLPRLKKNNLDREFLIKASKTKNKNPVAIDATAGMGEDSLLLASAGYSLSRSDDYDLAIAFCISRGIFDFNDINELLYELGSEVF